MEEMTNFVSYVNVIAEMLIMGYVLYRFAKPFMKNKRGAFYAGIIYSLTMILLYIMPNPISKFAAYGAGCFAAFLTMCRTDSRSYEQKAFITVSFFSIRWFTWAMAEILYDELYSFAERTDYMASHENMWDALYILMCVCYLTLGTLFTVLGLWCILKAYKYKHLAMTKKELLILALPSVMGVAGYEIIWYYRNFYIAEVGNLFAVYDALALLYYMVAIVTITVVIMLYQNIKAGEEEKLQNELLAAQVDSIRQHIEQVEELYQNIRSIRHDMTNHIITLERLYAGNKTEEADAYSADLKNALSELAGDIKSGNPVTDVILQEAKNKSEKRKIRFYSDFYYPQDSNVNAFDVGVILNNALQNALENTKEDENSYISVSSYRRNNAYMIEVNNSFTGTLQWDLENELPLTSKEEKAGSGHGENYGCEKNHDSRKDYGYGKTHGYGLSNIRRVARKYSGDIDIVLKDGAFHLSVMLMLV